MWKDRVMYLPLEKVITDGTCAAIRRWVLLEIHQFLAAQEGNAGIKHRQINGAHFSYSSPHK